MRLDPPVLKDRSNFYDGGLPAADGQPETPPRRGEPLMIVLDRKLGPGTGTEEFALLRRIAYDDRTFGQILVPVSLRDFRTDLTSVPALFTWLVPTTGAHLPAALLHDGLRHGQDEDPTFTAPEWHGPPILRVEADRIFRDAMADTGTGVVRRWLVWSAVATATMLQGESTGWTPVQRLRYRAAAGGTVALIVLLGLLAFLDLVGLDGLPALPWMRGETWAGDLAGGLAGAVVVPLLLGLTWGRFWIAGWVVGPLLAVMLPVTTVVGAVYAAYLGAERLATRHSMVARLLSFAGIALAAVVFVVALVG